MVIEGDEITAETLDSGVGAQTAGGYKTTDDAQKGFAGQSVLGLKDRTMNDLPAMLTKAGWTPETGITQDVKTGVFNNTFSAFATMQEDGSLKWRENIEDGARKEILSAWKTFESGMNAGSGVDPFAELKKDTGSSTSNAKSSYIPSAQIEENITVINKRIEDIVKTKSYSATQLNNMEISRDELVNQLSITKTIETDVGNADVNVDTTRDYLENGRDVKLTTAGSGIEVNHHIKAEDYKRYLESTTGDLSDSMLDMDIDGNNQAKFNADLVEMKRLEGLNSGKQSAFTKKYNKLFAQDTLTNINGRKSLKQAIAYHNYKAQTNENWKNNAQLRKKLEGLLTRTINDKPLTDAQIKSWSETAITSDKNTKQNASNNKTMVKSVDDAISDVSDGAGLWTTALDANVPDTANAAIAKDVVRNSKGRKVEDYVKDDLEWIDYGNNFFGTDTRLPNIKGVDGEVTKRAIDQVREEWNKTNATNFDKEDISFDIRFDEGSNNFIIDVYDKEDGTNQLGSINASNVEILANKKG